mmetsp:Transcript_28796/g.44768  ORF Transcript_28796/g.44768 Transcript_28796/m.44768 type:complete len:225 (-) Transcript_28796:290-964(-)
MLRLVAQQCNSRVITTCCTQQRPTTLMATKIRYNQNRLFATKKKSKAKLECPFKLLGVPTESKYSKVKSAFLKLAMTTHPDVVSDEQKESAEEKFIQIRMAFEQIRPLENGMATLADSSDDNNLTSDASVDDFDDWFYSETGKQAPIGSFQLDRETMIEVAKMEGEVEHGLDRDGGMWHLAGMIANAVKDGGNADNVLKLEMGDVDNEDSGPTKRRKRRKGPKF